MKVRDFLRIPVIENEIGDEIALPSKKYPSDHLPLMAIFEFLWFFK